MLHIVNLLKWLSSGPWHLSKAVHKQHLRRKGRCLLSGTVPNEAQAKPGLIDCHAWRPCYVPALRWQVHSGPNTLVSLLSSDTLFSGIRVLAQHHQVLPICREPSLARVGSAKSQGQQISLMPVATLQAHALIVGLMCNPSCHSQCTMNGCAQAEGHRLALHWARRT